MNPIITPFLPLIAKLGLFLLEQFLTNKAVDEESKRVFIRMAEELRKLGVKYAITTFESEAQIAKIDEAWKKEEEKK